MSGSNLKLLYTNANGLYNKMDELKAFLAANSIDIICITESHLCKDILDAEVFLEGFSIVRKDRDFNIKNSDNIKESEGGGSIIYYKNNLNVDTVSVCSKAPDSLAISVKLPIGSVCIACIYRSTSLCPEQNSKLLKCIDNICSGDLFSETIIVGDFNLPDVSWVTGSVNCNIATTNQKLMNQSKFIDLFNDRGLTWCFTSEITRRRLVKGVLQESLLDQVLVTNDALLTNVEILPRLGKSDHVCVSIELAISMGDTTCGVAIDKPTWSKISPDELHKFSTENVDWAYSSDSLKVEEMWEELHGKLQNITAIVPTTTVLSNGRPVRLPWSTSALKRKYKNKDNAWLKFDGNPTAENFSFAVTEEAKYDAENAKLKVRYEKRITANLKVNSKSFYSYLRNKRQVKTCIRNLDKGDGSRTTSASESAEVLADAFSSVFVREPEGPLPRGVDAEDYIDELVITTDDVQRELAKLNIYKSYGPDGIHPKLLKSLADDTKFVNAVTELFMNCSNKGTLPEVWKTANVTALFKKGSKADPLNYRPVSLTCILCKVYERLLRSHIVIFLEDKISVHQHGFVKQKSCLSNLLEAFDSILNILEDGDPVDVLYFDFSKAFDTVPHYRLLSKLQSLGIVGSMLNIIRDFLSNRTMRVIVEGSTSDTKQVTSGVPQGSVLGPLLFVLFINDLPSNVKSTVKLFADDLKLIGNANKYNSILDDLKQLEMWENIWLLKFNPTKCKVLHVNVIDNPSRSYFIDSIELEACNADQEKDLGVITSSSLLWTDQIKSSISKANKMICWVARNLITRDVKTMLAVYKSMIRPHIEYCVQLWNPMAVHGNWSLILELEGVQRRFTRLIDEVGTLPYSQRLDILKLTTLAERRLRGDLIEAFKAVSDPTYCIRNLFHIGRARLNLISRTCGSRANTRVQNLSRSFLSNRVVNLWNKLPMYVKQSDSVDSFKINLQTYKNEHTDSDRVHVGNYWDISDEVLSRIEGPNYVDNKKKHNAYLKMKPFVARKKFINIDGACM